VGNTIGLREPEKIVWDKLRVAATDPARVRKTDPGDPDKCNVFTLHKFFSDEAKQALVRTNCTTAGWGCIDCKKVLFEGLKADLDVMRARREQLQTPPGKVDEILAAGAVKARAAARETMARVRERLGFAPTPAP
jgi:tryptophanyl-tRNA synthetase